MTYLKLLEVFILSILMDKSEYDFTNKNFKPVKLVSMIILIGNLVLTVFLLVILNKTYDVIEKDCPVVLEKIKEKKKAKVTK